jgi:glycosyltransferase involved in cell wall biosynthesis
MDKKLTVLIPCKDERKNIRACIDSVRAVADEVLVADSGSTDGTTDVVRSVRGCRLIEREFVGYADFKNWAIPQASHPWVLIVDADERITDPLASEIRQALRTAPPEIDGYWMARQNYLLGHPIRHCGWSNDMVLRLFRRDRCRYRQLRVHEALEIPPRRTRTLEAAMLHYTYWTYDQFLEKLQRYSRLSAEDRWDRGRRASPASMTFGPLLWFFKIYVLRGGFRDGLAGFQVSVLAAFSAFMKQARLWELEHALPQPDPDARHSEAAAALAAGGDNTAEKGGAGEQRGAGQQRGAA